VAADVTDEDELVRAVVANASVFLASNEAAYVNGGCLPVDGGLSARSCGPRPASC
jgi:NAD(P)-dependent dehydrogenase (short-subunit alcohol dehydrogenase family)